MAKVFYTEKDIEDMVKRGMMSLEVSEDVVLTDLAYEKAIRLGMQLRRSQPDNPPSAPVRPYITQKSTGTAAAAAVAGAPPVAMPPSAASGKELQQRIHSAVVARLGSQVDAALLDVIIQRVLNQTGVK